MEKNPQKRIKPAEALNHPWIQNRVKNRTLDPYNLLYPSLVEERSEANYQEIMTKALIKWNKAAGSHTGRQLKSEKFNTISSEYQ